METSAPDRPSHAIAVLAAVTVVLISIATALLLWEMRTRDLERARLDTASLAHMFREQAQRTFEGVDAVLRGVQERMQTPYGSQLRNDGPEVRLLLAARLLASPGLLELVLTDAHGQVVNSSRTDDAPRPSLKGHELFEALAAGGSELLYMDRPVRAANGQWTMQLGRAYADTRGHFRGVAVVTMEVPRLDHFSAWMRTDHVRPLALYLADGTLLASMPVRDNLVGERPPELAGPDFDARETRVRLVTRAGADGAEHVHAMAAVPRFPLVVSVTLDDEPVLAAWRDQSLPIASGALLVCAFIVVSAMLLSREMHRKARLAQALRDARDRYHRTVDSVLDAIVAVDEAQDVILFNPAAERMFGLPASQAIGMPVARLLPPVDEGSPAHPIREFLHSGNPSQATAPQAETIALRADGTVFPVEWTLSRTLVDGKPQVTAVLRDVTERNRAERELREMNRQLRALSASLQNVREEERTRIASELHDELGQQLTGLKLELSWLAGRLKDGRAPVAEAVDGMRRHLDTAIGSVRRIATELRPRVLDDRAFDEALAWQAHEFAGRSGLQIDLDLPAAPLVADRALATGLYRIVQESLTNVARHSGAKRVEVRLLEDGGDLVLRVTDAGAGFARPADGSAGIGLVGMRERATALGGRLRVDTAPGRGTTIEVRLPLPDAQAEADLLEESL